MGNSPSSNREFVECVEKASQGDSQARYQLAWMYFNGYLTDQDQREAVCVWHELAADMELSDGYAVAAAHAYATCCEKGIGVAQDEEESLDWMLRAAEQGDTAAQQAVGRMYLKGMGCDRDPEEACYWLSISVVLGCEAARTECKAAEMCLGEQELERVQARALRSLLESGDAWSALNKTVDAIRKDYRVKFDIEPTRARQRLASPRSGIRQSENKGPIKFGDLELLRKRACLTMAEFAELLDVTRMTYHTWIRGGSIRRSNKARMDGVAGALTGLMASAEWPAIEERVIQATDKVELLRQVLAELYSNE